MKGAEIRDFETEELHGRIAELKEELFNLRFQLATGQLDNHRRMRACKQDIARIRTVLRERDFAAALAAFAEAAEDAPVGAPSKDAPVGAPSESTGSADAAAGEQES